MRQAVDNSKVLASQMKEKVNQLDIGTKVKETGQKAYDNLKIAGEKVKEKGSQVAVRYNLLTILAIFHCSEYEKKG